MSAEPSHQIYLQPGVVEQHEGNQGDVDPYELLHAKAPVLSKLTKASFPNYTSVLAAANRGIDVNRPDALCTDTFAEALSGEIGQEFDKFFGVKDDPDVIGFCALRCLMIDEEIENHLSPVIQQAVIIGSGMDSRSYRLKKLTNCHVFELDSCSDLAEHKKAVLKKMNATPITRAHDVIITDFANYSWPEELEQHGFDPNKPTVWIIEALLEYLEDEDVDRLFTTIDSLSAPSSQILVEYSGTGKITMDIVLKDGRLMWKVDPFERRIEGGILRACTWNTEMLLQRDEQMVYSGKRWDPERFARYHIPKEKARIGPWFVASCTKPAKEAAP